MQTSLVIFFVLITKLFLVDSKAVLLVEGDTLSGRIGGLLFCVTCLIWSHLSLGNIIGLRIAATSDTFSGLCLHVADVHRGEVVVYRQGNFERKVQYQSFLSFFFLFFCEGRKK